MNKNKKYLESTKNFSGYCMSLCMVLLLSLYPDKEIGFLKLKNKEEFLKLVVMFRKTFNDILKFYGVSNEICEIDSGLYVDYSLYYEHKMNGYFVILFYKNLRELNDLIIRLSFDSFPNKKNRWPSDLLDRMVYLANVNYDLMQGLLETYDLSINELNQFEDNMDQAQSLKKYLN